MRILPSHSAMLILFGSIVAAQTLRPPDKIVYLLEDDQQNLWCAFSKEATWKAEVDSLPALNVATIEYRGIQISKINVTHSDEAGDWIVYDNYSLDGAGNLKELHRKKNVLPGDLSEDEVFNLQNGKVSRRSVIRRSLSTSKVITSPSKKWTPAIPIVTDIQAFPFALALNTSASDTSTEKRCVPPKESSPRQAKGSVER